MKNEKNADSLLNETDLDLIREYLKLSNELLFNKFKEESDKNHLKKEKRSKNGKDNSKK